MHDNYDTMETDISILKTYLPKKSLVICREQSSLVINENEINEKLLNMPLKNKTVTKQHTFTKYPNTSSFFKKK